jgi:uncharacterized protein (TIGR03437 family)
MKQSLCRQLVIGVLALALPSVALADLSATTTLQANTALNLVTGATAASGGDILWNGSTITPQGTARAYNLGQLGASFDTFGESYFNTLRLVATAAPIPASALVVNDLFVVFTNGVHTSKVVVTANSGGSITLKFLTYIAAVPTGPTVTQILNNSSEIRPGFPNYGIAPSSIFAIVGSGLADPGAPVLQSSADPGLPTTLNGASITVTVNNVTVHPAIYYTSPAKIAAVLPAATPTGTGTLTVAYNGATSAPTAIKVVPSALGINTYNGSGVATDAAGNLITYSHSAFPGETLTLWTTGLGADPADSDSIYAAMPHSVNVPLHIYIGGVEASILYQGSAGYPGVNQINLTIPQSAPTGCFVSLVAVIGGMLNHVVTLPVNNGGGACFEALTGLTGNQVSPPGGQTLRAGLVSIGVTNSPGSGGVRSVTNYADAAFEKYTGLYAPSNSSVSPGGCIVRDLTPVPIPGITGLDPGTITLTGPNGLSMTLASQFGIKGAFYANLAAGAIPQSGGAFTFSGSGGADVGAFTATINFSPLLTWTNSSAAATIDRTQDLRVTWTGGNPGTYVYIGGTSVIPPTTIAAYTCLAAVDAGQFTVPSYILSALPAGNGGTSVQNVLYSTLSASGIDIGLALGGSFFSASSVYK